MYQASNPEDGNDVNNRAAIVGYGMGASYINTDGERTSAYADPGIEAAELAFKNAPVTEDKNRAKVMILFTDGTPGADYNNYGPGSSQYPDWVTPGINSAKRMKDDGVTIYSVGLFPSADGYHAGNISYDVTANGQGTEGFFANANCFLHLVSSNYPNAVAGPGSLPSGQ